MKYKALCGELYGRPLLMLPEKADEIRRFIEARSAGLEITAKTIADQPKAYYASERGAVPEVEAIGSRSTAKFVAVLPLFGTLWQHGGLEMEASGGTSTAQFTDQFLKLVGTPSIKTIVIHAHTPGGQVWGTEEASDAIYNARRSGKRIVAAVNSMAASAGLWIVTAAQEVYITPGGEMGSIGVVTMHEDISGAEEKAGIKTTLIAYPQKKVEGHPYAPLTDEVRNTLAGQIQQTYQRFVASVARNRGVSPSIVESRFGGGGMLRAQQAVAAGLADKVLTMQDVVAREAKRLTTADQPRYSVKNRLAIERLR